MTWLEDLFFLVAFAVAVALVTFSVYDGNGYPTVGPGQVVAASENREREMPFPACTAALRPTSPTMGAVSGEASPSH